jgi:hypothetical protein
MTAEAIPLFLQALGITMLWSVVTILIVAAVFELMQRRYHLLREVFHDNGVAAGVLAAGLVLGIFYTVTQVVVS